MAYIKLDYKDYKIIEELMDEVDDLNAEEIIVKDRVKGIIGIMEEFHKRKMQQRADGSVVVQRHRRNRATDLVLRS